MGEDSSVTPHGYGDVKFVTLVGIEELLCKLRKVLHDPELKYNLVSVGVMDELNFNNVLQKDVCKINKVAKPLWNELSKMGFMFSAWPNFAKYMKKIIVSLLVWSSEISGRLTPTPTEFLPCVDIVGIFDLLLNVSIVV